MPCRLTISALLGFLGLAAVFFTPHLSDNDGAGYFSIARSIAFEGNIDLSSELRILTSLGRPEFFHGEGPTGVVWNEYPLGWPLLQIPGILVGRVLDLGPTGFEAGYIAPAQVMTLILVLLGLAQSFLLAREVAPEREAFLAAAFLLLGTPLFFYAFLDPGMAHAASFAVGATFLRRWRRLDADPRLRNWLVLGSLGALLVMIRLQDVVYAILPLLTLVRYHDRRGILAAGTAGAVALIAFAPQIFTWEIWHGSLLPTYLDGNHSRWNPFSPHIIDALTDPAHGLFYWHPALILGIFGLCLVPRRTALASGLLVLAAAVMIGGWPAWDASQSFGHRMFVDVLPAFAVGIAALLASPVHWIRRSALGILGLGVVWNFALLGIYGARMISADEAVTHAEMFSAMAELPSRAGEIAAGFLNQRSR